MEQKELTPCPATVTFIRSHDEGVNAKYTGKCSLFAPHDEYKHYCSLLQLTCGGEFVTHDINGNSIVREWSAYPNMKKPKI